MWYDMMIWYDDMIWFCIWYVVSCYDMIWYDVSECCWFRMGRHSASFPKNPTCYTTKYAYVIYWGQ